MTELMDVSEASFDLVFEAPPGTEPAAKSVPVVTDRPHGTREKYVREKCRCGPCTEANRAYAADLSAETRRNGGVSARLVPADRTREHLVELASRGVGLRWLAKETGVSRAALADIRSGAAGRVRPATEEAVCAVPTVDTSFLVAALDDVGWPVSRLAARLDVTAQSIRSGRIGGGTYDQLSELARSVLGTNQTVLLTSLLPRI